MKTFEIRKNDRGFERGDLVVLWEIENGKKTGYRYLTRIIYITDYAQQDDYVVFALGKGKLLRPFE